MFWLEVTPSLVIGIVPLRHGLFGEDDAGKGISRKGFSPEGVQVQPPVIFEPVVNIIRGHADMTGSSGPGFRVRVVRSHDFIEEQSYAAGRNVESCTARNVCKGMTQVDKMYSERVVMKT